MSTIATAPVVGGGVPDGGLKAFLTKTVRGNLLVWHVVVVALVIMVFIVLIVVFNVRRSKISGEPSEPVTSSDDVTYRSPGGADPVSGGVMPSDPTGTGTNPAVGGAVPANPTATLPDIRDKPNNAGLMAALQNLMANQQ